jgi:dolichyl-phosphate beta-glucosyltransferase
MDKISIVIPAYNEFKNLGKGVLSKVIKYTDYLIYPFEVILVDDGSKDDTVRLIKKQIQGKKGYRLIENPHRGKAITVMTGILAADGEIIFFIDMDQATPIQQMEKFFPHFVEGCDIVIGSRHGRQGAPPARKLYAWGFTILRKIILGLPFSDTQCGFKAFNKKTAQIIFPKLLRHWQKMKYNGAAVNAGFDVDLLFLARRKGFKIAEIPVEWSYVGSERVRMGSALEAFADILRIRLRSIRGGYR